MDRSDVSELHYMTPMANLGSIASLGLLSHARAAKLTHESVAMEEVQDIRAGKRVPGRRPLHEYANLYFHARNAMMFTRRCDDLVVVRIASTILDLDDVVISDGNAANKQTLFYPSPAGLANLDAARVYAKWWTAPDYWEKQERKRQRQAEVLVPDCVSPEYILGCYARRAHAVRRCRQLVADWAVEVNPDVYFDPC